MTKTEIKWMAYCAALAVGEACAFLCGPLVAIWPAAACLGAVAILVGYGAGVPFWRVLAVFVASFCICARSMSSCRLAMDGIDTFCGGMAESDVTVAGAVSEWSDAKGARWMTFPGRIGDVRLKIVMPASVKRPRRGEVWHCKGWLSRRKNEGGRPRAIVVKGKGASSVFVSGGSAAASLGRRLEPVRDGIRRRMGIGLESRPKAAERNCAMLLGGKSTLSAEDRRTFSTAGTVHVFAVSGLHVMALAWGARLAFFFVPARFAALFVAPVLFFYVIMIGSPPSAVRAALAATLYFAANAFWRRPDAIVALCMAFVAFGLVRPLALASPGAMFSFAVTLSLVLYARMFFERNGKSVVAAAIAVPVVAWAAGVPISARMFGTISFGGIVANAAVVPAAGVAVAAEIVAVAASFLSDTVAAHANNFAALVTGYMASISRIVASIPGCRIEVEPWPVWICALWYVFMAILAGFFHFRKKFVIAVVRPHI